jgi:hypothetical protein
MARIRTIKPDFWTDDDITECSLSARLLFIGIWNFADDAGNLDRSAKQIKARVFPVDNVDCEPLIQELITQGLLIEYSVNAVKYLHIPGFTKHQVINRPSKPSVPAYDISLKAHGVITEPSVPTHAGREGKGREDVSPEARALKSKKSPKTRLPADLSLTPDLSAYFATKIPDCDPVLLFEQFTGQARAKGWEYVDWIAAAQTYCRNAHRDSGHFSAGQYPRRAASNGSIHAGIRMS